MEACAAIQLDSLIIVLVLWKRLLRIFMYLALFLLLSWNIESMPKMLAS